MTYEKKIKVISKEYLNKKIILLRLKPEQSVDFEAGQFLNIRVGDRIQRSYSIASSPDSEILELLVDITPDGPGTTFLKEVKEAESLNCLYPLGNFVLKRTQYSTLYMIATGTGIAPFRSMLLGLKNSGISYEKIRLLWGLRYFQDSYILKDLHKLEKELRNFEYTLCLTRPEGKIDEPYFEGRVTAYFEKNQIENDSDFMICGNVEMAKQMIEILGSKGILRSSVEIEAY